MSLTLPSTIGLRGADVHIKISEDLSGPAVGTVYAYGNGQYELSLGVYPSDGSVLVFDLSGSDNIPDTQRPLAAIIKGPLDDMRVDIGKVTISGMMAQASFFGIPPFDARIVF